mmetsp:Transcript_73780/g.193540  ORF Transcript_73780/g.193540 Transcript_73780/m.193540 type:complete len:359 (+) Transcript_73780:645-1721(+)
MREVIHLLVDSKVESDDAGRVVLPVPILGEVVHGGGALLLLLVRPQPLVRIPQQGAVCERQVLVDHHHIGTLHGAIRKPDAHGLAALHDHLVHVGLRHQRDAVLLGEANQGVLHSLPATLGVPHAVREVRAGEQAQGPRRVVWRQAHVERLEGEDRAEALVLEPGLHEAVHGAQHVEEWNRDPSFYQHLREEPYGVHKLRPRLELPVDEALDAKVQHPARNGQEAVIVAGAARLKLFHLRGHTDRVVVDVDVSVVPEGDAVRRVHPLEFQLLVHVRAHAFVCIIVLLGEEQQRSACVPAVPLGARGLHRLDPAATLLVLLIQHDIHASLRKLGGRGQPTHAATYHDRSLLLAPSREGA